MVELDSYQYLTTRNGVPETSGVSICNVFVCKVMRAAGVFGNQTDFQCGETSVNDMYRLNIYERNYTKPSVCTDTDNPICQVLGKHKLRLDSQPGVLPRYNYVPIHKNFAESCPSLAPDYKAPIDC